MRLLVIVGPTAVGKSALAMALAERFHGAIVSADSRQIYRGMDIGTAKPTPEERQRVPHYLIDIVEPHEPFSLAQFQQMALAAIRQVHAGGRLPILVGGTGQYVRAVTEGWEVPHVPPQPALRAALQAEAERDGPASLHGRLRDVDPEAAARIDPRNVRRVIRALEVYRTTGTPISALQRKHPPAFDALQIGLRMERARLYERIDARLDAMLAAGLRDEVKRLRQAGYGDDLPSMSGLGYRQLCAHLRGEISLEEAVARIKRDTRRFVHQQMVWFRADDPSVHWEETGDIERMEALVQRWLERRTD